MMKAAVLGLGTALVLAVISVGGCQRSAAVNENLLQLDEGAFELAGPFVHENMTIFLLNSNEQDDRDFITLDEGLKDGVVKVSEQNQAQVNQLEIENDSDHYLFLQEGDRVVGGQQDRIIITSLVVPPKSGKMPLPSFCVEAGRWQGQKGFYAGANAALAPKDVREASKVVNQQGVVWDQVRVIKHAANSAEGVNAPNTNTSLNETLEAPQVKQVSEKCSEALKDILAEKPNAVGVVVAVNGKIEEVNIYPNHKVLSKQYPRLLKSYALQAAINEKKGETATLSVADVRDFMTERKEQAEEQKRDVNKDNYLYVCPSADKTECRTEYDGKVVHSQWLSRGEASARQVGAAQQNEGRGRRVSPNDVQNMDDGQNIRQRPEPQQPPAQKK
jgi:hypothetical protein